ncbi:MAG TPA: hypothetical protein VFE07_13560 [Marmoricola sp.]|nr:hypothetical protein [Marmoricola sp.]
MSVEQRGREAAADLLSHTRPDTAAGLVDLQRLRSRRNTERSLAVVAVLLAAVALGFAMTRGNPRNSEPIDPHGTIRNGELLIVVDSETMAHFGAGVSYRPRDMANFSPLAFDADGTELVYVNRKKQVVAINVEDGAEHVLSKCPATPRCDVAPSPDGRMLAVRTAHGLELRDLASGGSTLLGTVNGASSPAWSADGRRIAFATPDGIDVIRVDGTGLHQIDAFTKHQHVLTQLSWAPDGHAIAFMRTDDVFDAHGRAAGWRFTLMTVDTDGSHARVLHDAGGCICAGLAPPSVAWSPDGKLIAFGRLDPGNPNDPYDSRGDGTYVTRPDGTGLHVVGSSGSFLAWQPVHK